MKRVARFRDSLIVSDSDDEEPRPHSTTILMIRRSVRILIHGRFSCDFVCQNEPFFRKTTTQGRPKSLRHSNDFVVVKRLVEPQKQRPPQAGRPHLAHWAEN